MLDEFKRARNAVKATRTFVLRKVKTQMITVSRWLKKFRSRCKNLDNRTRSDRPKRYAPSAWRISGETWTFKTLAKVSRTAEMCLSLSKYWLLSSTRRPIFITHLRTHIKFLFIFIKKVGGFSSCFNSYDTEVWRRALLHSLDYSTLPLILTLYCWLLSKAASSTIFESLVWLDQGLNSGFPDNWRH